MRDKYDTFEPKGRAAWRRWLQAHHASSRGILLVYVKRPKRLVSYSEAVEEALCFGWIDSVALPIDEARYMQLFTPRRAKSGWSALNKGRAQAMIEQGLMTPAGLAKIAAARADGSWAALDHIENGVLPPAFEQALRRNRKARAQFDSLSPFARKIFLYYLGNVKREENRAKRIAESIERLAAGAKHPREPIRSATRASDPPSTRGRRGGTRRPARRS